jgi:hypothetical protein
MLAFKLAVNYAIAKLALNGYLTINTQPESFGVVFLRSIM